MAEKVYTIRDLWRRCFTDIKEFDFSYESFRRYLQESAGSKKFYSESEYEKIKEFLRLKFEVSRNFTPAKSKRCYVLFQVLKTYNDNVPGKILLQEASKLDVCSPTTIYKKSKSKLGKKFSFLATYSVEDIKKLIL